MVVITGSYKLAKSENFEEYMKSVGVGAVMRKLGATATPTTEITQSGDEWRIKTTTTFKTTDIKFKLGVIFDEETADGRKCKSIITLENGNKLVHKQTVGADTYPITREFSDDEMIMKLEGPGGIVSTRVYKRL